MENNSELVDFERGSTFGGIMTTFVLVGFIGVLVYDLSENIKTQPYTFTVRDKFMSPEETRNAKVIMGKIERSQEFALFIDARHENGSWYGSKFNIMDNDYFDLIGAYWDTEKNEKEG